MSLDIMLTHKRTGEEIISMNWLRNPYGLATWAEDNYQYATHHNQHNHAPEQPAYPSKVGYRLYYVCNHWAYKSSSAVNRPLFKRVVDQYAEVLLSLDKAYYFFDTSSFIQFVLPHWELIPQRQLTEFIRVVGTQDDRPVYLGNRMGFNIEWFDKPAFNLRYRDGSTMLEHYKRWMGQLVNFAELLQNKDYRFYCSN